MKILKGEILSKSKKNKHYSFASENGLFITIPFEKVEKNIYLINGDIINIKIDDNNEFLSFVDKITNKHFEKLKMFETSKEIFKGYVFAQNPGGFSVSYNGYKCFLPISKSEYKIRKREDKFSISKEILNKELDFEILKIIDNQVYLSREKIDKKKKKEDVLTAVNQLKVGELFLGEIIEIFSYGLLIKKDKSAGLLYISNIFYFLKSDKQIGTAKQLFEELVNDIFCIGDKIFVEIIEIKKDRYKLNWNFEHNSNNSFWKKILQRIFENNKFSYLKNIYYHKNEELKNVDIGLSFKGKVETIKPYGLFVRKSNVTGLVHLTSILTENEINNPEFNSLNYLNTKYNVGELINVEIIEINEDKIGLKLKNTANTM